jgi:hypothetical protein
MILVCVRDFTDGKGSLSVSHAMAILDSFTMKKRTLIAFATLIDALGVAPCRVI